MSVILAVYIPIDLMSNMSHPGKTWILDQEIHWLPIHHFSCNTGFMLPDIKKRHVARFWCCMGEVLQALLSWELRILTRRFELTNDGKLFWGFFPFERQYRPTSVQFKRFHICFIPHNERLFRKFSTSLCIVLLQGTADAEFFFHKTFSNIFLLRMFRKTIVKEKSIFSRIHFTSDMKPI